MFLPLKYALFRMLRWVRLLLYALVLLELDVDRIVGRERRPSSRKLGMMCLGARHRPDRAPSCQKGRRSRSPR